MSRHFVRTARQHVPPDPLPDPDRGPEERAAVAEVALRELSLELTPVATLSRHDLADGWCRVSAASAIRISNAAYDLLAAEREGRDWRTLVAKIRSRRTRPGDE